MCKRKVNVLVFLFLALTMSACQKSTDEQAAGKTEKENDPVLVKVNGQVITQKDLDVTMLRLLGPARMAQLDDVAKSKILDSLVMSRLISGAAEAELDTDNKDHLERQVRDYREEILVKQYLRDHVEPQPITQGMVKAHYEKYPERYGAIVIREYQLLTTSNKPEGAARQNLLKIFNDAKDKKDWNGFAKKLKQQNYAVTLKQGKSNEQLLHQQLQLVMSSLKLNETSRPFLIDGVPQVVRITAEQKEAARPLSEVSAAIRKALLPGQLKIAIKQVADDLKKSAKIEYMNHKAGE
jgi:hypothetical protein